MNGRKTQRGLALITAMLVVAIVATIAAYLSLGQQVWLRQVQNLFDRNQADSMRHAALHWIGTLLARDAKENQTDHLGETWAGNAISRPSTDASRSSHSSGGFTSSCTAPMFSTR